MTYQAINPAELEEKINRLSKLDLGIKKLIEFSSIKSDSVVNNHSMYNYILSTIPRRFSVEDLINYHEYLLTGIKDKIAIEILIGESRSKFSGNSIQMRSDFEKLRKAKQLYKKLNRLRDIDVWLSINNNFGPEIPEYITEYNSILYSLNAVSLDELLDYRAYSLNSLYEQ